MSSRPVLSVVPKLIECPSVLPASERPSKLAIGPAEERFFATPPERPPSIAAETPRPPSQAKNRVAVLVLCVLGTTAGVVAGLRIEERAPSSHVMELASRVAESGRRDAELRTSLDVRAAEWEAKTQALQTAIDEQALESRRLAVQQAHLAREVADLTDVTKTDEKKVYQLSEAVKDIDLFVTLESHQHPTIVGKKLRDDSAH